MSFAAFRMEMAYAALAALVLGLILLALLPADRRTVRHTLVFLIASALIGVVASAFSVEGARSVASMVADVAAVGIVAVLVRLAFLLFFRVILPALNLGTARIVEDLSFAAAIVALGLAWLRLSGMDLSSLVATSAVITGVIAFSMQETLGNLLGGLVLQFDRSIRVGDWIRFDDVSGRVVEVRWRYTAVETRNRETVYLPNGALTKQKFMVIGSRGDRSVLWRRWVWINVGGQATPAQVCATLEKAISEADIENVAKEPAPKVILMDFVDRGGRYAIRYWLTDPAVDDPTDSLVRAHALAAIIRAGMHLAAPYAERMVEKENESMRASRHAEEIQRRLAALAKVEIFAALTAEELLVLAEHLVYAPFVRGDTITRQGAVAHWLYLVVTGEADVWVEERDAGRVLLNTLPAGSVVGEMGMMTGEPRRATVTARTDVECYRLDKVGFAGVLHSRPDIATEISKVLAGRSVALEALRKKIEVDAKMPMPHGDILQGIRKFFGLDEGRPG
jgi:small-conductance mechanosensitive channel